MNGKALNLSSKYTIATNDFTAADGDTYGVFLGKRVYKTGVALEGALVNYTRDVLGGVITTEKYGTPAGRITGKQGEIPVRPETPAQPIGGTTYIVVWVTPWRRSL